MTEPVKWRVDYFDGKGVAQKRVFENRKEAMKFVRLRLLSKKEALVELGGYDADGYLVWETHETFGV